MLCRLKHHTAPLPSTIYQHLTVGNNGNKELVELRVVFYLKPPATSRSPEKSEWHVGRRRLVNGKVY